MASIVVNGDTSGSVTLSAPAISGTTTLTLPTTSATIEAFPSGTKLLFQQTSAPTGWTKSTTHDNKALRVVSGAASSGGTVAFTTAFASQAVAGSVGTSGATTLSTGQIPNHYHSVYSSGFAGNLGFQPAVGGGDGRWYGFSDAPEGGHYSSPAGSGSAIYADTNNGGGGSHTHSGGTFTGTAIDLTVQYVDIIIATKN